MENLSFYRQSLVSKSSRVVNAVRNSGTDAAEDAGWRIYEMDDVLYSSVRQYCRLLGTLPSSAFLEVS